MRFLFVLRFVLLISVKVETQIMVDYDGDELDYPDKDLAKDTKGEEEELDYYDLIDVKDEIKTEDITVPKLVSEVSFQNLNKSSTDSKLLPNLNLAVHTDEILEKQAKKLEVNNSILSMMEEDKEHETSEDHSTSNKDNFDYYDLIEVKDEIETENIKLENLTSDVSIQKFNRSSTESKLLMDLNLAETTNEIFEEQAKKLDSNSSIQSLNEEDEDYETSEDNSTSNKEDNFDYYDLIEVKDEIETEDIEVKKSVLEAALENSNKSSTESKFLPNLTLDQLANVTDEMLEEYANKPEVYNSIPDTKLEVFEELLNRLPVSVVASIASKPGLLMMTSDEHIVIFSKNLEAVRLTDDKKIADMVNARPHVIATLPWRAVDIFMQHDLFIASLKQRTIDYLVKSRKFANKLNEIPKRTLAKAISKFPQILANLPPNYPAWELTQRLVNDKEFLMMVPVQVHAYLAGTRFRHQINAKVVRKLLQVYPHLPAYLSEQALFLNRRYFRDQSFLSSLTCSVFLNLANNPRFVNRLKEEDLKVLSRNMHMWQCLPVGNIRKLLKVTKIGTRLKFEDVVAAATTMSKAKSLDLKVVWNLLQFQVPDMTLNFLTPKFLKSD